MSPVAKVSISLSPAVFKQIENRAEGEENSRSEVINRDLSRYYKVLDDAKRGLKGKIGMHYITAGVAACKNNRPILIGDRYALAILVHAAYEAGMLEGIFDDIEELTGDTLLDDLQDKINDIDALAIVDLSERYWIEVEDKGREGLTVERFMKELYDANAVFPKS